MVEMLVRSQFILKMAQSWCTKMITILQCTSSVGSLGAPNCFGIDLSNPNTPVNLATSSSALLQQQCIIGDVNKKRSRDTITID